MNPLFHTEFSISDSLKNVRKSVLIYETIIDYRDGKVTKEDLDKCSTCDMNCVINNGLSEASKEQLKHKTGEEIVDADIAQQMEK